ncbi:MAG: hypothetical protein J3R72DRAFT_454053, partial [Linnemannia gamsii]
MTLRVGGSLIAHWNISGTSTPQSPFSTLSAERNRCGFCLLKVLQGLFLLVCLLKATKHHVMSVSANPHVPILDPNLTLFASPLTRNTQNMYCGTLPFPRQSRLSRRAPSTSSRKKATRRSTVRRRALIHIWTFVQSALRVLMGYGIGTSTPVDLDDMDVLVPSSSSVSSSATTTTTTTTLNDSMSPLNNLSLEIEVDPPNRLGSIGVRLEIGHAVTGRFARV